MLLIGRVLVGLLLLVLGRRLYWLFVAGVGFLYGLKLAPVLMPEQSETVIVIVALVLALVGALVAVNALGRATVGEGPHFWAAPWELGAEFGGRLRLRIFAFEQGLGVHGARNAALERVTAPIVGARTSASGGAMSAGGAASGADQVSRRSANTAVPLAATSPPCDSSIAQCWVERLVRSGSATTSNSPSASAAAKLTVSATGSPCRAGCCSAACSTHAAVTPPNGPTMFA